MSPPVPRRRRTVYVRPDELDDPGFRPIVDVGPSPVSRPHDHAPPGARRHSAAPAHPTERTEPGSNGTIVPLGGVGTPDRDDRSVAPGPMAGATEDTASVTGATDARFDAFYRDAWDQVARGLTATLGDRDLAVDATDEAMARAYAHWAKVGGYDFPAGWVYRVGLNWARSYHRRLARALPLRRTEPAELDGGSVPGIADPAIRDGLLALDVKHRSVVVCRLLLDWSVDDTAAALNIAPGTVKSRLSRALTILESTLGHLR